MGYPVSIGICILGLGYIYIGYPMLVWLLSMVKGRRVPEKKGSLPTCSMVIVAYNESSRLPQKINSLARSSDWDRLENIYIASDGSTDNTVKACMQLGFDKIRLIEFKHRRGKPAVLNELIPTIPSEIVLLADARQHFADGAITRILHRFLEDHIGVVSGELVFVEDAFDTPTAKGMGAYWYYEKWIRKSEGVLGCVPGATGAIYAIRKAAFKPIPEHCLLDDVAIPLLIMRNHFACTFEAGAIAYDTPSQHPKQEETRKRRTIAGNIQLIQLFPWLWYSYRHPAWFSFWSHKAARLASPFLLVTLFFSSLAWGAYEWVLLQVAFYLCALGGRFYHKGTVSKKILSALWMFLSLNIITLKAWMDAFRGRFKVTWERSTRLDS